MAKDDDRFVKYPDGWSRKDLIAYVDEEKEMRASILAERNALRVENGALRWQLDRVKELLATAARITTDINRPTPENR